MKHPWRWLGLSLSAATLFGDGVADAATIIWITMGLGIACAVVGWALGTADTPEDDEVPRDLPDNVVPFRRVR